MKRVKDIVRGVVFALCTTLLSCAGGHSMHEVERIDSLNRVAYEWRYRHPDSSFRAAHAAYHAADAYRAGRAEAANQLGFCAFMRMDYDEAERRHREVYSLTKNELERLIADVGLMKICQRTAQNKEFYDYRNSAERRMRRIAEDEKLFASPRGQARLAYARSEFYIVSAIYYYYLQQRPEALECIGRAGEIVEARPDTNQLLYYHYIKGSAALCEGDTPNERRLREFDELFRTWRTATMGNNYLYFEANALQGLAGLMMTPEQYAFFENNRPYVMNQFHVEVDSLLPKRFAEQALEKFSRYNDLYQIVGAYVSIGKYLNMHGNYEAALDTLTRAMNYVERQRHTVPEWVLRIHEQLCVSHAGLGRKAESDFHRNAYLDILDNSRQDKELESRYQALEEEAGKLNLLIHSVVAGFVVLLFLFWLLNRQTRRQSEEYQRRMQRVLGLSEQIIAAVPTDAEDEEQVNAAIERAIGEDVEPEMLRLIHPYVRWALHNGMTSLSLGDERKRLEKQRYLHEQHIAENKRQNIIKKACLAIVSGIHPYIDRIVNEARKLTEKGFINDPKIKAEKYQYIDELVSVINRHNDILARWIKMKQGSLSLHIETFGLAELFDLLRKGSRAFELKQQTFEVLPTEVCVRADKALTLFMLNTLAENARKYTPRGGRVKVSARQAEEYVEISVEDTGRGLSAEDVARITGEKVYDAQTIGMGDATDRDELRQSKGSGFGLMNCRGIIEKYRKTNELFRVCLFGVESRRGEGSRFFFRLPVGVRRTLTAVLLVLGLAPQVQASESEFEVLLDRASDYADAAYYNNVDGRFEEAILCIDSAMTCLNEHYSRYADRPQRYMALRGEGRPAELAWWEEYFDSDFHVILDIRNEAAVAFLALKQWDAYTYNNVAYTTLYKLLGEDQSLEAYCLQLERSTTNKTVGIALAVLLLVSLLFGYYYLYIRKRLVQRWNLEQVLEINERLFSVDSSQTIFTAFDAINELFSTERLTLATYSENSSSPEKISYPTGKRDSSGEEADDALDILTERCLENKAYLCEKNTQLVPLLIDTPEEQRCIGVLILERRPGTLREDDPLYLKLIARYMAIVVYNDVVKLADQYRDIEEAQDEARRASWEENQLHVQNQVLDNCLSTIKHETLYYPNKIKQLITRLRAESGEAAHEGISTDEERETVRSISELISYYKGIFTLLHACAARQLEEVTFRRTAIPVDYLLTAAEKHFHRAAKNHPQPLALHTDGVQAELTGDMHQLRFLLASLIDEALSAPQTIASSEENHTFAPHEALLLTAREEGDFIRFTFTDKRRTKSVEELNRLFYPDDTHFEYLICKQIIREHDEYAGIRGCRINAEACEGGGFSVYFTVPRRKGPVL